MVSIMNKEKLIRLLKTSQITNHDIEILKNSPNLFEYLINKKHENIINKVNVSDNKKLFIILNEKLYCIDIKLDDDKISYEIIGSMYSIIPEMLDCNKDNLCIDFCAQAIGIVDDVISLETFHAEQSHDGIMVNKVVSEFIMDANDMINELDLPRKKYTYYKDIDDKNLKVIK